MASTCENWDIPYLNLSTIKNPGDISDKLQELEPKIILSSIEDISSSAVQAQLQTLNISYIAIDECQVVNNRIPLFCALEEQCVHVPLDVHGQAGGGGIGNHHEQGSTRFLKEQHSEMKIVKSH